MIIKAINLKKQKNKFIIVVITALIVILIASIIFKTFPKNEKGEVITTSGYIGMINNIIPTLKDKNINWAAEALFDFFDSSRLVINSDEIIENDDVLSPEIYVEEKKDNKNSQSDKSVITKANLNQIKTIDDMKKHLYTIDNKAYVSSDDLNLEELSKINLKSNLNSNEPKVLIFHTHSQEDFKNSRKGIQEDTIVGVGQTLAQILAEEYNISVVHDVGNYDTVQGRGASYEVMDPFVKSILKKYPSIEVCIDLHRDGVSDDVHLITDVNGKPTAKIMYFNGICRRNENNNPVQLTYLPNPYIKQNLAMSLQMQLKTNELYPDLARHIYIKPYRYSLHFKPKSLLIEAGANTNTVEEVKNAMYPLAEVINDVLNEN